MIYPAGHQPQKVTERSATGNLISCVLTYLIVWPWREVPVVGLGLGLGEQLHFSPSRLNMVNSMGMRRLSKDNHMMIT